MDVTWQAPEAPLPPTPFRAGRVSPASLLTLWLQLVQYGLCPTDHTPYCNSSHSLSHIADAAEARMGLLGVVVGRRDQVECGIEQGQAGHPIDSALKPERNKWLLRASLKLTSEYKTSEVPQQHPVHLITLFKYRVEGICPKTNPCQQQARIRSWSCTLVTAESLDFSTVKPRCRNRTDNS